MEGSLPLTPLEYVHRELLVDVELGPFCVGDVNDCDVGTADDPASVENRLWATKGLDSDGEG